MTINSVFINQAPWYIKQRVKLCSSTTRNRTPAPHREFPDSHWPIYSPLTSCAATPPCATHVFATSSAGILGQSLASWPLDAHRPLVATRWVGPAPHLANLCAYKTAHTLWSRVHHRSFTVQQRRERRHETAHAGPHPPSIQKCTLLGLAAVAGACDQGQV